MDTQALQPQSPVSLPCTAPRRRWWLDILLALLILGSGMVVGSALTLVGVRRAVVRAIQEPERGPSRAAERLRRRLNLSNEQTRRVREVIARHTRALIEIRRETQPRVRAQLQAMKDDVAAELTPEQARRWRERFERLEQLLPPPPPDSGRRSDDDNAAQ